MKGDAENVRKENRGLENAKNGKSMDNKVS